MNQSLGDRHQLRAIRAPDGLIRTQTRVHGGGGVKSMGDGFMLTFPSAKLGLSAGIAIQRRLISPDFRYRDAGLDIRMGLTVGEPIREEQDMFRIAVVMAARIGNKAVGCQILKSHIVHDLLSGTGGSSLARQAIKC